MRKAFSGVALAILSLAFIVLTAGSGHADVSNLKITLIGYNARGNDTIDNRNKEFVDIKNDTVTVGSDAVLTSFVLTDHWGKARTNNKCNHYTFGTLTLKPGETVRVYTGAGNDSSAVNANNYHFRYMNHGAGNTADCGWFGHYINNLADTVYLLDSTNVTRAQKSFDFENGYTVR